MTVLRGPSDKAAFRDHPTEWKGYVDPLPPDDIATPIEGSHMSVSEIKKAWPKFLTDWAAREAAKSAWKFRDALVGMSEQEAIDLIAPASNRQRDAAAKRGHSIHDLLEFYLHDGDDTAMELLDVDDAAASYVDTLRLIAKELNPEIVASEIIVFGTTSGQPWAGTFDGVVRVTADLLKMLGKTSKLKIGDLVIADYKSRKDGKAATRYAEDGVQVGGYSSASYWIVEDDTGLHRLAPLDLAGGLIISIAPDGYRLYEVDLVVARSQWTTTVEFKVAQGIASKMFGRCVGSNVSPASKIAGTPATVSVEGNGTAVEPSTGEPAHVSTLVDEVLHQTRVAWALNRIDEIKAKGHTQTLGEHWPFMVAVKPKAVREGTGVWSVDDVAAIVTTLDTVEGIHDMPFGAKDPAIPDFVPPPTPEPRREHSTLSPAPDEGTLPEEVRTELRERINALPKHMKAHVNGWVREAIDYDAHLAFNMGTTGKVSMRRYTICSAAVELVRLVEWSGYKAGYAEEKVVRAALELVIGDIAQQTAVSVGALLGTLSVDQADRLTTHRLDMSDGTAKLVTA